MRLTKIPFIRACLFTAYLLITCAVLAEVVIRAYFAIEIGPRTLLYGTDWHRNSELSESNVRARTTANNPEYRSGMQNHIDSEAREDSVERHSDIYHGYTKFFPNESKSTRNVDTGNRISVSINRQGFRGSDFNVRKNENVIRILTLGASSTFGFYDEDDETYPSYLQQTLNDQCESDEFEVINFGIPHASSANVAALFLAEGLELKPDVVTFYQGRNDSPSIPKYDGLLEKAYSVLVHRFLLVALIDQIVVGERESITATSYRLEPRIDEISETYLNNLQSILTAAEDNGIRFIVANQQATSAAPYPRPENQRISLKGVTYADEAQKLREKLTRGEAVASHEISFLVHQGMMQRLERWASDNQLAFVDVIGALDQDRHLLLSWVHLHPLANRVVAERLAEPILNEFCEKPVGSET